MLRNDFTKRLMVAMMALVGLTAEQPSQAQQPLSPIAVPENAPKYTVHIMCISHCNQDGSDALPEEVRDAIARLDPSEVRVV